MTARKPTKRAPAAPPAEHDEDFDQEAAEDIEQILSGAGDQAIASIYRVGKPGERDGFIATVSTAALLNPGPEQFLQDNYGAGSYRLKLKAPNKGGVLKYAGMKTLTIAEKPGAGTNGNGRPHTIEEFLLQQANDNKQMMLTLLAAMKPQQLDLAGLGTLISSLTGGNKQSDLGAVVAAFTALKQSAEPTNPLTGVKDVLEIAKSISGAPAAGDGGDGDGWLGLIRGGLQALGGGGKPRRMIGPGGPDPNGAGGDGGDDEEENEEAMFQQWLRGQLGFLKSKAATNKPVDFWIKYTIDNADEVGNQAIFAALKGGATFDALLAFDPEIATNPNLRLWFQQFYDGLKRSLSPAATIPWIVGNTPNSPGNAAAGDDRQQQTGNPAGGGNPGQP